MDIKCLITRRSLVRACCPELVEACKKYPIGKSKIIEANCFEYITTAQISELLSKYFYDGFENGMGKWSQGVAGSLPQASVGNYNGVATKSGGYMASSEAVAFNTYKADMMQHSFGTELEDVVITYWMCWDATIDYGTTPATKTAIIIRPPLKIAF